MGPLYETLNRHPLNGFAHETRPTDRRSPRYETDEDPSSRLVWPAVIAVVLIVAGSVIFRGESPIPPLELADARADYSSRP